MAKLHQLFTRSIMRISSALIILLLLIGVSASFIQFYPFPKSQVFMKYPNITTIHSGKPGDPINVMILGNRTWIIQSFEKAGWVIPDPITPETSAKIAIDSLANRPYPTAPVSNLYLYGHKQDLAFDKPTNDVQNRDHIRLWDTLQKSIMKKSGSVRQLMTMELKLAVTLICRHIIYLRQLIKKEIVYIKP